MNLSIELYTLRICSLFLQKILTHFKPMFSGTLARKGLIENLNLSASVTIFRNYSPTYKHELARETSGINFRKEILEKASPDR